MNIFNISFKNVEKDTKNPYTLWELAEIHGFPFKFRYSPKEYNSRLSGKIFIAIGFAWNNLRIEDHTKDTWDGRTKNFYYIED